MKLKALGLSLSLAIAAIFAPAPARAVECDQLSGGVGICLPRYGTDFDQWAQAEINAFSLINSSAMVSLWNSTGTLAWLQVQRISGISTGTPNIRISSPIYSSDGAYLAWKGSATVEGAQGLGITYGLSAGSATITGNAFSVGVSTFVVKEGYVLVGTTIAAGDYSGTVSSKTFIVGHRNEATGATQHNGIAIRQLSTTANTWSGIDFSAASGASGANDSPVSASIEVQHGARTSGQYHAGTMIFTTSPGSNAQNAERMRISSDGRVGIGTSVFPSNKNGVVSPLVVSGSGATSGAQVIRHTALGAGGGLLTISGTRGTTASDNTIVQSGDGLGSVIFSGADGNELTVAAEISVAVDGTPGDNDMPGRLIFKTTADGGSTATERVRIDNAGLVGIGATTPSAKLHVKGAHVAGIGVARFEGDADHAYITLDSGAAKESGLIFKENGTREWQIKDVSDDLYFNSEAVGTVLLLDYSSGLVDVTGTLEAAAITIPAGGLADGVIYGQDIAQSTITLNKLNASGCASNQIPKYNGTSWACGDDNDSSTSSCPAGFTEATAATRRLGCGQTAEEGSADAPTAAEDCFDTYGGRLPSYSEMAALMNNYAVTDECEDDEWLDSASGGGNHVYWDPDDGGACGSIGRADSASRLVSKAYRCWIPK